MNSSIRRIAANKIIMWDNRILKKCVVIYINNKYSHYTELKAEEPNTEWYNGTLRITEDSIELVTMLDGEIRHKQWLLQ